MSTETETVTIKATETVTIKATEKLQALAKTACEIQDAANPLAIVRFLDEVIRYWYDAVSDGQKYCGSDISLQNPVTVAVLNKLESLAHMEQSAPNGAGSIYFVKCMDLAEGQDVEVEVQF
jgi:hypothetical protein